MEIGTQGIIIIVTILLLAYFVYITYYNSKLKNVVSKFDNREYIVQDKEDANGAADLIAHIRKRLILLVNHLLKAYPNDDRVERVADNFDPDKMKEGIDDPNYTSYSINKGEQVVLCLRSKNKLMDINTMMFVVLHEMTHIATVSIGHTTEFWDNFRWLLEESINIGIYIKQEFDKKPIEYCGMSITDSPLD